MVSGWKGHLSTYLLFGLQVSTCSPSKNENDSGSQRWDAQHRHPEGGELGAETW